MHSTENRFTAASEQMGMRWPALCLTLAVVAPACGKRLTEAERRDAVERSLAAVDPNAEPLPPRDPPEDGIPELNTEYWLGTRESEEARVLEFGKQIQALQQQVADQRKTPPMRGFHAKSHGCLHGELRPRPDRDNRTRYGLFADPAAPRPVWVRYSNGVGWRQADDELDARGMAMKVMNVAGQKYLDDELSTQDFLMTNSPTPVGMDAEEFMQFAHANVKGRAAGIFFLLGHPRTAGPALTSTGAIASAVGETYWSGSPYHLGAHQAVKYLARPCEGSAPRSPPRDSESYLRDDLAAAAKSEVCYTLFVQFQVDAEDTPIENASKRWDEDLSVPLPVADIVMPAQELAPTDFCDGLAFTPWHSIAAHKPMGNHNRARRIVYASSQQKRGRGTEPAPWKP